MRRSWDPIARTWGGDALEVEAAIRACFRGAIAQRAQQLWDREGRPPGRDLELWVAAESEILGRAGS